jgi:hypothetical protein
MTSGRVTITGPADDTPYPSLSALLGSGARVQSAPSVPVLQGLVAAVGGAAVVLAEERL